MTDFNPKSPDAMFSRILARLDQQDKETDRRHQENKATLDSILAEAKRTNGRVTKLESKYKEAIAWIGGAAFVIGILWALFVHFTK